MIGPRFEGGKTYSTAGGHVMKVKFVGDHHPQMVGQEQDVLGNRNPQSLMTVLYNRNGTPNGTGCEAYQLLPGAIDEGQIEQQSERIDNLEKHCEAMQGSIESLQRRVAGQADVANRVAALEEQMTAALGITISARPRPATPVEQAINALDDRLGALELGLELIHRHGYPAPNPPKPTIKGGSVNVYRDCGGSIYFGTLDGRKHDVDELVACIQIPDITEGEGL